MPLELVLVDDDHGRVVAVPGREHLGAAHS